MAEAKEFTYEYDPVKHSKDGSSEPVIWSTAALNTALDAINKGLPLKANPFCGKNTCLLKPDLLFKRTQEEIDDYIKCIQDPVFFGEKCEFMTPAGLTKVTLRDYQRDYLHLLQNNRFTIFRSCRQSGKCLSMLSEIIISINTQDNNNSKLIKFVDCMSKKYYYYINNNNYIIKIPIFELFKLFDNSVIGILRYKLYNLIFYLEYGRKTRAKMEQTK